MEKTSRDFWVWESLHFSHSKTKSVMNCSVSQKDATNAKSQIWSEHDGLRWKKMYVLDIYFSCQRRVHHGFFFMIRDVVRGLSNFITTVKLNSRSTSLWPVLKVTHRLRSMKTNKLTPGHVKPIPNLQYKK